MDRIFTRIATWIATLVGQPQSFVLAFVVIFVWAVSGPLFHYSDTWQLLVNSGSSIVTLLMVFLIQNSQNRDAAAMQAKLDELIRAVDAARGAFIGIEHLTDKQIAEIRRALETEADCRRGDGGKNSPGESVERLLDRYDV
jgi:low affinity Fe/Cu permease